MSVLNDIEIEPKEDNSLDTPDDFIAPPSSPINPQPVSPDQLNLALIDNRPKWQIDLENFILRLKQRNEEIKYIPYWSDFFVTAALGSSIISTLFSAFVFFYLFFFVTPQIPTWPINYLFSESIWISADRFIMIFVPWILGVILAIINYANSKLFTYDKRLSRVLGLLIIYLSIMIVITATQIFRLVNP